MTRLFVPLAFAALLAGCATPQVHSIPVAFDAAMAEQLLKPGPNTIKGKAFVRQEDSGVVTCAGEAAYLIPMTEYARFRMQTTYGSVRHGVSRRAPGKFFPDDPRYRELVRETKCDAQGSFAFDRVADGAFFVVTAVRWQAGNATEQGTLMQNALVGGGSVESLILSP